jgi:hypothetical protein
MTSCPETRKIFQSVASRHEPPQPRVRRGAPFRSATTGAVVNFQRYEPPNGAGHALSTMEAERWSYRNRLEDSGTAAGVLPAALERHSPSVPSLLLSEMNSTTSNAISSRRRWRTWRVITSCDQGYLKKSVEPLI